MKWLIYHLYLKPIIRENLRQRFLGNDRDEWFWADQLAVEWGYFCTPRITHKDYNDLTPKRRLEMLKDLRDQGLEMIEKRPLDAD